MAKGTCPHALRAQASAGVGVYIRPEPMLLRANWKDDLPVQLESGVGSIQSPLRITHVRNQGAFFIRIPLCPEVPLGRRSFSPFCRTDSDPRKYGALLGGPLWVASGPSWTFGPRWTPYGPPLGF